MRVVGILRIVVAETLHRLFQAGSVAVSVVRNSVTGDDVDPLLPHSRSLQS